MERFEVDVIGKDILVKFGKKHANARPALDRWLELTESADWKTFEDVKATFPATDYIPKNQYCFDIGGNNYRILAAISFVIGSVTVLEYMTHSEYDKKNLKKR